MARFYGEIGYAEESVEEPENSGNWVEKIVEFPLYGDIVSNNRRLEQGENLNDDISVGNSISVVADAYAREHFHAIRYAKWSGTPWIVTNVIVQSPRLLLQLGGVYHGELASSG